MIVLTLISIYIALIVSIILIIVIGYEKKPKQITKFIPSTDAIDCDRCRNYINGTCQLYNTIIDRKVSKNKHFACLHEF
jgi:hypothetical protein